MELSDGFAFSELIGRPVRDQAGRMLGRVVEVRGRWLGDEIVLEELLVGRRALWRRLRGPGDDDRGIPWASVTEVDDERVVVDR